VQTLLRMVELPDTTVRARQKSPVLGNQLLKKSQAQGKSQFKLSFALVQDANALLRIVNV